MFAFDPSLAVELETSIVNEITLHVPWESDLTIGPIGEFVEIVDYDPASGLFYEPVDLNDPALLATDGLAPSEGNVHFHQQMVYAVVMKTVENFERAFGRAALFLPRRKTDQRGVWIKGEEQFTKLRVYPHAMREANAYYSPAKKALLFGYFPAAATAAGDHLPGGVVFTCLSHDIVAHETSHALLDALQERLVEASNPDALAFHEALADLVALLQRFSLPEVLKHEIARTRGDLQRENRLAELAQQFGRATGGGKALRSALGHRDPLTGLSDPTAMQREFEPHARGSILVAAVFDAFLAIYQMRSAPLVRLATAGTGDLPQGHLHPDLVNLLAAEASKAAAHLLNMCLRALDYCPPLDVTFSDFLRAIITADRDLYPFDPLRYRVAVIEAFRRRGIHPAQVRTLSEDQLAWQTPADPAAVMKLLPPLATLRQRVYEWETIPSRAQLFKAVKGFRYWLNDQIMSRADRRAGFEQLGLDATLWKNKQGQIGPIEVRVAANARRIGADGKTLNDLVVVITQARPVYFGKDGDWRQLRMPEDWMTADALKEADFWYRGGCTLIVDLITGQPRYCVTKNMNISDPRLTAQAEYAATGQSGSLAAMYFGGKSGVGGGEPFALLHRGGDDNAWA